MRSRLRRLEAEAISIIREVVAEFRNAGPLHKPIDIVEGVILWRGAAEKRYFDDQA